MDAAALLAKARESAQRASTSKRTLEETAGDDLAAQQETIKFVDDDEDDEHATSTNQPRRQRNKQKQKKPLVEPASIAAPRITLAQDLASSLVDDDSRADEPGSKWNKLPYVSRSARERRVARSRTAGPQWFDMPATPLTKETKREIQALRLMNTLDPKSFMRASVSKDDKQFPEFFQVGHVIDSSQRATTQRASEQERAAIKRKKSFVEQLVEDDKARAYLKRKTVEVRAKGMSGKQKPKKARLRP